SLSDETVQTWPKLIEQLLDEYQKQEASPSRWIMNRMDKGLQERIRDYQAPTPGDPSGAFKMIGVMRGLQEEMRKQMRLDEFYDPESWSAVPQRDDELKELLSKTSLNE